MATSVFGELAEPMDRASAVVDPLAAAVQDIQTRSVAAYLRRQQLEAQRQRLQHEAMLCDQELLLLDGELRSVTALQKGASHGE